jgi:hypothetical protein
MPYYWIPQEKVMLTKLQTSKFVMLLPSSVVDICCILYGMNLQFGLQLEVFSFAEEY